MAARSAKGTWHSLLQQEVEQLEWNDKKHELKKHEASLKVDKEQVKGGIDARLINAIKPQSDVFKAFLPQQGDICGKEKNLEGIEQNYTYMNKCIQLMRNLSVIF